MNSRIFQRAQKDRKKMDSNENNVRRARFAFEYEGDISSSSLSIMRLGRGEKILIDIFVFISFLSRYCCRVRERVSNATQSRRFIPWDWWVAREWKTIFRCYWQHSIICVSLSHSLVTDHHQLPVNMHRKEIERESTSTTYEKGRKIARHQQRTNLFY